MSSHLSKPFSSMLLLVVMSLLITLSQSSTHCSIHGDTHVLMSDGTSKYAHHSSGLFRVFAASVGTKRLDVQCEFTDRNAVGGAITSMIPDPEMSACRLSVIDVAMPTCGGAIDIRHGGTQRPGYGTIAGQDMALSAMNTIPLPAALGMRIIPLINNGISVEMNWNGTFTQVVMGMRNIQVHSPAIGQCVGLCGTCSGAQYAPTDIQTITAMIASQVVMPQAAIQPIPSCGGVTTTTQQYPYPQYVAPAVTDAIYTTPQFESQTQMLQVFAQCAADRTRLRYDPIYNSFVEDCMYDKSLGPGFELSAKASLDAFITWTESLLRVNRIGLLTAMPKTSNVVTLCAACIPVQWTDPVQTGLVLQPTVTARRGTFAFQTRYNGQNNYALQPLINAMMGGIPNLSSWNTQITMPSLSSLPMLTLPLQLITAPIIVTDDSHGVDTVSWNPMPSANGGVCSLFDAMQRNRMEQIAAQYAQSGQLAQLAQMVLSGQLYSVCYAVACSQGALSTSSSLGALSAMIAPSQLQNLCPISQQFGQSMANNNAFGMGNGAFNAQLGNGQFGNAFNGINNALNGQFNNAFNGVNNAFNGVNNAFNGQFNNPINGAMPGQFNGLNGLLPTFNPMMNGAMNNNNGGQFLGAQNTLNSLSGQAAQLNNVPNQAPAGSPTTSQVLAQQNGQQNAMNPFFF